MGLSVAAAGRKTEMLGEPLLFPQAPAFYPKGVDKNFCSLRFNGVNLRMSAKQSSPITLVLLASRCPQ